MDDERRKWLAAAQAEYDSMVRWYDERRAAADAGLVAVEDELAMQEVGFLFEGDHPTRTSAEFAAAVKRAQQRRKDLVKAKQAVKAAPMTLGGSAAEGRKMSDELSKLMLRAYNSELDALIRSTTASNAAKKVEALDKKREQVQRLGRSISIELGREYHDLARWEIKTTGEWKAVEQHEREAERERKAQLREEAKARKELEAAEAKYRKEVKHYTQALKALEADGDADPATIAELQSQLAEAEEASADVTRRAANTRAGYVYVISNPGSMGEGVVKIGMTRRLEPMDRVVELGDASVPFRFSVHALLFSDDAVGLETELHRLFSDRRLNKVNLRREFFRVQPNEVRQAITNTGAHIVEWDDDPVNEEWTASQ